MIAVYRSFIMLEGDKLVRRTEPKHLGMILGNKLSSQSHAKDAILKSKKGVSVCWVPFQGCFGSCVKLNL